MMGRLPKIKGALREELWRRYKAGETILGIGRALDQRQTTIHRMLQTTGGIAPARRSRSSRVLSFSEREEISRGVAAGCTFRAIARGLHRAVSTVSQEVARHGGRPLYRAAPADSAAWESARRPKLCLLAKNQELQRIVTGKLKQEWSPQQIAGWLREQYPGNPEMWVSHETIYRSLFVQARGALKKELTGHLRSRRRIRRGMPRIAVTAAVRSSVRFPYERDRQKQPIERSQDTGKVIWWKALAGLTSQHWSNVNRDSSSSSNFPKNEPRLLSMLSARQSASFLPLYVAR
jgi:hypothetical protein